MVSKWRLAAGAVALVAVVLVLGYYFASSGTGSSEVAPSQSLTQANGTAAVKPLTTTVVLPCAMDGDTDNEPSMRTTTTYSGSGTTTVATGTCILDTDGDGI
jgi:hypothetical protein